MHTRIPRALSLTLVAALTAGGAGAATLAAAPSAFAAEAGARTDLTAMTYNIHHGVGMDGTLDLDRIAADIRTAGADVVGLQEVDNHWGERSNFENQAERLAELLDMNVCFSANLDAAPAEGQSANRQYGTAILSSHALSNCANTPLTNHEGGEQRGLAQADVDVDGQTVRFYNTHLTHNNEAGRLVQAREVAQIVATDGLPSILVGDLNAVPESDALAAVTPWLADAWTTVGEGDGFTIPPENPDRRIDYVLAERTIEPLSSHVVDTMNSDHLPVVTELRLPARPAADGTLRFAMISDIQYADTDTPQGSTRYYRDSIQKLQKAAAAINADGAVDFTIHTGDMGDRYRADFGRIMPYFRAIDTVRYNAIGNHDYNEGMTTAETLAALDMHSPYYDVVQEGYRIVVLDSTAVATFSTLDDPEAHAAAQAQLEALQAAGAENAQTWNGGFGEQQLTWLDGVLADAKSKDQPVLVFMHNPVFGANMHNAWDSDAAQEVLARYGNVEAVLNGHDHAGRYAYEDGIHYFNQRGFVERAYPQTAWSFVTVEDGGIRIDGQGRQESVFLPFDGPAEDPYGVWTPEQPGEPGQPGEGGSGDIPVTAEIPGLGDGTPDDGEGTGGEQPGDGALVLSIADGGLDLGNVRNAGDRLRLAGTLPTVSVTDSRAANPGWSVTGQATDLATAQERVVRAENLGWAPYVHTGPATPGQAVQPRLAGGPGLALPATLGTGADVGTADLAADVDLEVPVDTAAGTYTGGVTVSLFPQD